MRPGTRIVLSKPDFIASWFGDLLLQEPKPTGLEEAADEGPLAIACHLSHHSQVFAKPGQEPKLNVALFFRKIGDLVPTVDSVPDPIHSRHSGVSTQVATTHLVKLLQAIAPPLKSPTEDPKSPRHTDWDHNDDDFNLSLVGVTIYNLS